MRISDDGYAISGPYGEALEALRTAARRFSSGDDFRAGRLYAAALRMSAAHLRVRGDYNTAGLLEMSAKEIEESIG